MYARTELGSTILLLERLNGTASLVSRSGRKEVIMASILTDNLFSLTRGLALGLTIAGAPGMGLAKDEASLHIATTTVPVTGMSVVRDASSKDYRVLWPGQYPQGVVSPV
jgi:hypothetical protein